jgi:hypothetical protein
MIRMRRLFAAASILVVLAACSRGEARPAGTVDSVIPWDTALARFREGLAEPAGLHGGATSLDALVDSLAARLERADTAGLTALALTRAEFAYLYYPTVPEARPPYDLAPGLFWFTLEGNSSRGLMTLLGELGGRPLGAARVRCEGDARHFGENAVWPLCLVQRVRASSDTVEERLFGPIVERDGIFKFVSYANKR